MGNETFLLTTASPTKPPANSWNAGPRGPLLLAAKNSIPLFWYLLYDLDCLVDAEGPAEDGGTIRYSTLSSQAEDALALARGRWPRVGPLLGPEEERLFVAWADFVERHAAGYLHCETWEWSWLFPTRQSFRSHIRTCLAAFDHVPRRRGGRIAMNRWWRVLTGQCAVDDRGGYLWPLGDFSFCGVTYGRRMPWSRELRETESC